MNKKNALRSVLYIPADNLRALEKTKSLNADAFIFDLEDAVAENKKEEARKILKNTLNPNEYPNQHVTIRINAPNTEIGQKDLNTALKINPDAILIPKVNSRGDVKKILKKIQNYKINLWIMIETPNAITNINKIAKIAQKNPKLTCFIMGTNDLAKETQTKITQTRTELITWLSICVLAAKTYNIDIVDGVFNNFKDTQEFKNQVMQARNLGMDGKTLIHPNQIDPCHDAFQPSRDDVKWAQNVIELFKDDPNKGAANLNGEMVERLHIPIAQKILARTQSTAKNEKNSQNETKEK